MEWGYNAGSDSERVLKVYTTANGAPSSELDELQRVQT